MIPSSIKAVTFDLWNTLIEDSGGSGRSRAARRIQGTVAALDEEGRGFSAEHIENAYSRSQHEFEEVRKRGLDTLFQVQMDDFLETIEEGLALALSPEAKERVAAAHLNAYLDDPPGLMPGALDLLETLKGRGYRLGLICNSGATPGSLQREWLKEIGVADYLEFMTFSDEEELAKPSPEIFLKTLRALGVSPEASVHIGDRPETDILGAKGVGMRAVLIGNASCDGLPVGPDARVQGLAEVPGVVERLART